MNQVRSPQSLDTPARDESLRRAVAGATDTRRVVLGRDALDQVADCFVSCVTADQARPNVRDAVDAVVVADETTYEVAGRAVERVLRAAGRQVRSPHVFPASPRLHADFDHALWLRDQLSAHDAVPIAVGAGTINDLTKLASHMAGRPYAVVATAASMDGYAAFGAAITHHGVKQTMSCPAPRAVVADTNILAAAPREMTASGFGDLLGKITAGADWIVADVLGIESIAPDIWATVQPAVREAIAAPERLRTGEAAAVESLFLCLTMSGLAMQAARSSRPASGAEHQLSHLWEMRGLLVQGREISHGFKVGVGTTLVAEIYDHLLRIDLTALDVDALCRQWPSLEEWETEVRATQGEPALCEQALAEVRAKYVTLEQLRLRLTRLTQVWPALSERLRRQLLPASEIRRLLQAAGCPSEPAMLGLSPEEVREALNAARQIRRRYTILDLAAETGVLRRHLAGVLVPA
ncbi:MAG TPA: sn-glycerol-1-phosphate dehydrogenase [Chloroflexota bacterium]|nr:sn-glycerol-1-phosphate dehydrogenase [Chloroflexota bacterium]